MARGPKPFWERVAVTSNENDCWLWKQSKGADGYGTYNANGKTWRAHRYAYETTFGSIPDGMLVCHSCDTPLCCNPSHLWIGSHQDNSIDMYEKGRGVNQLIVEARRAELTDEQVKEIRSLRGQGATHEQLALIYGVHKDIIRGIAARRLRADVL